MPKTKQPIESTQSPFLGAAVVYIVYAEEYDDGERRVEAIFLDKSKAENYAKEQKRRYKNRDHEVEEFPIGR